MIEEKLKAKGFYNRFDSTTEDTVLISDALSICQEAVDDERNIGARLMAERILNELKNPSGGKFGCDVANEVIDYHKEAVDEAVKLETVDDVIKMLSKVQVKLVWLTTSEHYNNVCDFIGDAKNYLANIPELKEKL